MKTDWEFYLILVQKQEGNKTIKHVINKEGAKAHIIAAEERKSARSHARRRSLKYKKKTSKNKFQREMARKQKRSRETERKR